MIVDETYDEKLAVITVAKRRRHGHDQRLQRCRIEISVPRPNTGLLMPQ